MNLVVIEDRDDSRLAPYRIVRDGDLLRREGLFIAEGRIVVGALLTASPFPVHSVLLTPTARNALPDEVLAALEPETPVYLADRGVLDGVLGFRHHQGCLAAGIRGAPTPFEIPEGRCLVAILEDLVDPDNVGACFRNARALGADRLLLSPSCCDPLYRKAIRTSMAASLLLPWSRLDPFEEGLDRLRAAGFSVVALSTDPRSRRLGPGPVEPHQERLAVVVGPEHRGPSSTVFERAQRHYRIPMVPGADSFNVATALALALSRLGFADRWE